MPTAEVSISGGGRAGSISYREGVEAALFGSEFGGGPVLASIWGTKKRDWNSSYPWALGRQAEIYDFVAKEVVRQKAPNSGYEIELESGRIDILLAPPPTQLSSCS